MGILSGDDVRVTRHLAAGPNTQKGKNEKRIMICTRTKTGER